MSETAWAYYVVSSAGQTESLPMQRRWAKETAARNGWTITREFGAERDGVASGKHGVRKLMQRLIDDLASTPKTQRPARVLMVRVDRTGRGNAIDAIAAIAQIRQLGVTIHTRTDGDLELERVAGTLKPIFDLITGGLENEARSDKAKAGHERRRRDGKHAGHAPYGVKLVDGRPKPDGPRARIVRKAFEMRATGAGYERIAHALAPSAPPKPTASGTRAIGWHRTFVRTLLACRTYRGVVVDVDLFDRVQSVRNPDFKERGKTRFPWPLSGVVKCSGCGYGLTGHASGGNCARCKGGRREHHHARIRYYKCNNPIAHRGDGKRVHVRGDDLEAQFESLLGRLSASPELIDAYRPSASEVDALRERLRETERELAEVERKRRAAWDLQADGRIDRADIARRLTELRDETQRITGRVQSLRAALSAATSQAGAHRDAGAILGRAARTWRHAKVSDQKELARLLAAALGGLSVDSRGVLICGRDGSTRNNCEPFCQREPSRFFAAVEALCA